MKFVKLHGSTEWCVFNEDYMTLESYRDPDNGCSFTEIDENSPEWAGAEFIEAEDWHDLYLKNGYSPLYRTFEERFLWVAPDGTTWKGDCHAIDAEQIVAIAYGEEDMNWRQADDFLIQRGWVKLSTFMDRIYEDDCMYLDLTFPQEEIRREWYRYHFERDII